MDTWPSAVPEGPFQGWHLQAAGLGRGESWAEKQLLRKLSCSYELLESWDGLSQLSPIVFRGQSPDPVAPTTGGMT